MTSSPLLVALFSTPRSGNTWIRRVIADALDLREYASNEQDGIDWKSLDPRAIVQMHEAHGPFASGLVEEHGVRIASIRRHPLDVLVSILHFCRYEPATARWCGGIAGDEREIVDASPNDEVFIRYCQSQRARVLLGVSASWVDPPGVVSIRYEDVVEDPIRSFTDLIAAIEPVGHESIMRAVNSNSMEALRATSTNNHFWMGRPGLWRSLMVRETVERIAPALERELSMLGYAALPDETLSLSDADAIWRMFA